jgi:hypothetical protein
MQASQNQVRQRQKTLQLQSRFEGIRCERRISFGADAVRWAEGRRLERERRSEYTRQREMDAIRAREELAMKGPVRREAGERRQGRFRELRRENGKRFAVVTLDMAEARRMKRAQELEQNRLRAERAVQLAAERVDSLEVLSQKVRDTLRHGVQVREDALERFQGKRQEVVARLQMVREKLGLVPASLPPAVIEDVTPEEPSEEPPPVTETEQLPVAEEKEIVLLDEKQQEEISGLDAPQDKILRLLKWHSSLKLVEMEKLTGVARVVLGNAVNHLLDDGLVRKEGQSYFLVE